MIGVELMKLMVCMLGWLRRVLIVFLLFCMMLNMLVGRFVCVSRLVMNSVVDGLCLFGFSMNVLFVVSVIGNI